MVSAISWARKSSTPPSNWCWRRVRPRRCSSSRWRSVSGGNVAVDLSAFRGQGCAAGCGVRAGTSRSSTRDATLGVQDRLPHETGQTRLDLLVDVGRYRRRRGLSWPAEHVRGQELAMVGGEIRWSDSIYWCFTRIGVRSKYGSTADQGRTGREDSSSQLWRLARALGTHAKQSPSTGHSAVGLRAGRETVS